VPVAEGAVTSQVVVFKPSLYTVRVANNAGACEPGKHEPAVVGVGIIKGQLNVAVAVTKVPLLPVASAVMRPLPVP
jgi:hypothetical protein